MIVVIIGMHRSGTSALSGLLHKNGICMGEARNFSPSPARENPKGFFENFQFRTINDQILDQYGYQVKDFDPDAPVCYATNKKLKKSMELIIINYQKKYKNWGFKDPRTCLTLSLWKKAFSNTKLNPKYILINRSSKKIAKSMLSRGNEGTHRQFTDLANSYYNIANLNHKFDFTIEFESLIKNTNEECKRLSDYLDMPIINNGFVEKGLSHQ